jgi:hypothetical protein
MVAINSAVIITNDLDTEIANVHRVLDLSPALWFHDKRVHFPSLVVWIRILRLNEAMLHWQDHTGKWLYSHPTIKALRKQSDVLVLSPF